LYVASAAEHQTISRTTTLRVPRRRHAVAQLLGEHQEREQRVVAVWIELDDIDVAENVNIIGDLPEGVSAAVSDTDERATRWSLGHREVGLFEFIQG